MNEVFQQLLSEEVSKNINENKNMILQALLSDIKPNTDLSPDALVMCLNAIEISTVLSLTKVFAYLTEMKVVCIDEEALRRVALKPLE